MTPSIKRAFFPVPVVLEDVCCPHCKNTQSDALLDCDNFGFPIGLHVCVRCGFLFSRPRPTRAWLVEFYRKRYRLFYEGRRNYTSDYVAKRRWWEIAQARVERYARLLQPNLALLEIGSGAGCFAAAAARFGARVVCLELDRAAAAFASAHYGCDVRMMPIEEMTGAQCFDAIFAFHVLEHVDDLDTFLRACRRLLRPGGHLVVEVPDIERDFRDVSFHHVAHLYAFNARSLLVTLESRGFRATQSGICDYPDGGHGLFATVRTPAPEVAPPLRARVPTDEGVLRRIRSRRASRLARSTRFAVRLLGRGVLGTFR